jgi:hypothetical protein
MRTGLKLVLAALSAVTCIVRAWASEPAAPNSAHDSPVSGTPSASSGRRSPIRCASPGAATAGPVRSQARLLQSGSAGTGSP